MAEFARHLSETGHTLLTVRSYDRLARRLGRWLARSQTPTRASLIISRGIAVSSSTHSGLADASHLDLHVLNERLYDHEMHRLVCYKVSEPLGVGKVAKVVYACRGQKMMDSVSRRPQFTRFRDAGFRPATDPAAGNPVSPGPSARRRGFGGMTPLSNSLGP